MKADTLATLLILVVNIAGAIGFGVWIGNWGAGLVAFAVLSIAFRFSSK